MSARVLNPAMMTEISRNLGGGGGGGRAAPSRAALARVRRDLFGPVDHAAARALAERELRAQSLLDSDRWGFNFQLGVPRSNSRYEWEPLTELDVVPEPYALRGMPYLRKYSPGTPRKLRFDEASIAAATPSPAASAATTTTTTASTATSLTAMTTTTMTSTRIVEQVETVATPTAERTPPQEPRVPEISSEAATPSRLLDTDAKRKRCATEPTTPVLPHTARKQSTITDYMKTRKRGLNGTTKSMIEPPEKIARNAGQIRS